MVIVFEIILSLIILAFPPRAHAIIILPAVLLIPLVKLIAIIIGAFSIPIASVGVVLGKLTKNYKRILVAVIIFLCFLTLLVAVVLRMMYPENPWI